MKSKKTNIKIKRSKVNLYNKRKNKTKQILSIVLTVVGVLVLGIVGYGIGKPVMNYLNNRDKIVDTSSDPWDMSGSSESSGTQSAQSSSDGTGSQDGPESSGGSETSEPSVPVSTDTRMYVLPTDAAASSASLSSALAAAKESGCGIAVVTLKNTKGELLYKSGIENVKDSGMIKGSLSAAQICDYIVKAGLTPAAKINTLLDSEYPKLAGGYMVKGGGAWLDDYPDQGGKRWLSPFDTGAISYIGGICEELSGAGFKHIICANTMYPEFHKVDISDYLSNLPLGSSSERVKALWNVIDPAKNAAEKNGARLWVEVTGSSLVSENRSGTDAELAIDSSKLSGVGLIADYSANAEDAYGSAKEFASLLKTAANGAETAALIRSGISGAARSDVEKALSEAGIAVFSES